MTDSNLADPTSPEPAEAAEANSVASEQAAPAAESNAVAAEQTETEVEVPVPPAAAPELEPGVEIARLKHELEKLRATVRERDAQLEASQAMGRQTLERLKDQHERMLRAAADLDNYKKRAARERDEVAQFGQEKLLRDVLPVFDNLDRALEHAASPTDFDGLKSGIQMTRKLFEDALGRTGMKSFSAVGQPFDPNVHEAMQAVESDEAPGTVVGQLVRGFTLHGRLVRPAMVVVAKPRAAAPAAAAPASPAEPAAPAAGRDEEIGDPEAATGVQPAGEGSKADPQ